MIFGKADRTIGFGTDALGGLYTEVSPEAAHDAVDAARLLDVDIPDALWAELDEAAR
jgi:hypothetical protein